MGRAVLKRRAPKPWGKDFMSKYKMDDNTIADTKKATKSWPATPGPEPSGLPIA